MSYSVRYVQKLLARWKCTPQKPTYRAYEQDPAMVHQWLKYEYWLIRQRASKQRGIIYWLDETGIRSQHQAGTTYAPKGKTPVMEKTGQRFYLNMISAITNSGRLEFMVVDGNFQGKVFIAFLEKLIRAAGRKVFLMADSHPVHIQKMVLGWLWEHRNSIEMFLLPTYSPELNPDEYFNQDVKTNLVGKARPRNKAQLNTSVKNFSYGKRRNPEKVKKYFHPKTVAYAR